jgi:hypothetical protein
MWAGLRPDSGLLLDALDQGVPHRFGKADDVAGDDGRLRRAVVQDTVPGIVT